MYAEIGEYWNSILNKEDGDRSTTYDELQDMLLKARLKIPVYANRIKREHEQFLASMI